MKKLSILMLSLTLGALGFLSVVSGQFTVAQAASEKYAITTSAVKAGTGTLPKGTRVAVGYTTTKNGHKYAAVDALGLSYELRRQTGNKKLMAVLASKLKYVATKGSDSIWLLNKSQQNGRSYSTLVNTTDGYVEYYKTTNISTKPISSTRLTATRTKGVYTYLYAKTNMPKLPDRRISKSGNYQYRLTIRDNRQSTTNASKAFSVGTFKNFFTQLTGNA